MKIFILISKNPKEFFENFGLLKISVLSFPGFPKILELSYHRFGIFQNHGFFSQIRYTLCRKFFKLPEKSGKSRFRIDQDAHTLNNNRPRA